MRTIVDIPEEQLKPLDALCKQEGISRAEAIREAVGKLLAEKRVPEDSSVDAFFGIWKDREDMRDGLDYQLKLRAEWDERERDIDRRLGVVPSENDK